MSIFKSLAALIAATLLVGCIEPEVDTGSACDVTDLSVFTGGTEGFADGTGAAAQFSSPLDITTDGTNLFVADGGNDAIRKIVVATGEVTTFATFAEEPRAVAVDGTYLYVAKDDNTIDQITIASGVVTPLPLVGSIDTVLGMATDGTYLYLGERGSSRVSRVRISTGEVTVLAGSTRGFSDGTGIQARFASPMGIEIYDGNLYVADFGNNRIRKIVISTGEVTTLAGTGEERTVDGEGSAAAFKSPTSLVRDGDVLYVSDYLGSRIRKVEISTGKVTSLSAEADADSGADAGGDLLSLPLGVTKVGSANDPDGVRLFVVEGVGNRISELQYTSNECEDEVATQTSVKGAVTGLTAKLVLQNGSNEVSVLGDGEFSFEVTSGSRYNVVVKTQPNGQLCTVTNGSGTATAAVSDVAVSCQASATPPLDPTPPASPTIADLTTVDRQPTLSGTYDASDAGGGLYVNVNGRTFTLGTDDELTASGDNWSLDIPTAMAIGSYDIKVTVADTAGNTSSASGNLTVVLAPASPTVTPVTTKDPTPTLSGTFEDANTTGFTVDVGGVTYTRGVSSALSTAGNSWTLTIPDANALSAGSYEVVATATDGSGDNKSDTTTLELVITSATSATDWVLRDVLTNDPNPTISGFFPTDHGGFTLYLGRFTSATRSVWWIGAETRVIPGQGEVLVDRFSQQTVGTFDRSTGEWQVTIPRGLNLDNLDSFEFTDGLLEGQHELIIKDRSGDGSFVASKTVAAAKLVIDFTAPSEPTVTSLSTIETTPTITGTFDAADAESLTVAVNNTTYTLGTDAALTASGDTWSLAIPSALNPGTYDVVVTATDGATNSASDSTSNELVVTAPIPAAPEGVVATAGDGEVTLAWDAVAGAASYNVYYGTSSGVTTASGTELPGVSSGDAVTGLSNGTTYYFIVTAVSTGGESTGSSEVSATPVDQQAPTVSATPAGTSFTTSVDVSLACIDTGGSGCAAIHYTLDGSAPTTGSTTYSDVIPISTTTTLRFLAVDGAGNQSAVVSETYTLLLPVAPTGVLATAGNGEVSLTWTAVTGATVYNLYYATSSGVTTATGTKVANVNSGDAISGLVNDTTYYVIVTAENASGEGPASSEVSATPIALDTTPPAVSSGGLTPGDGATGVARDSEITAAFDEDIFAVTVDDTTFTLATDSAVSGTVSFDALTNVATLAPDGKMAVLTPHTATLTTGITDQAGNPLAADEVWTFTTADGAWQATPDTVDTSAQDNNGGRVVVDEQGVATAVWLQFDGTINSVVANRYVPDTGWGSSPASLEAASGNASGVELAVDSDGNVFAVWQQADGSSVWHIWAARYEAASDSWSAPVQLDTGASDAGAVKVAVDGNGNAIAVWNQFDGTRNNLWASRFDSGTWSTAELIENEDSNEALEPALAMDSSGNAVVVWILGNGIFTGDVKATRFSGGAWNTTAVDLETRSDTDVGFSPQVAFDSNGNAIAVWGQADDSGTFNTWANRYNAVAGTWSGAETIADGNGNVMAPQIAVDGSGNALAVWLQDNGNDVWSNRFTVAGPSWGTPEIIDNLAGAPMSPQIAMDATGHGIAIWFQEDTVPQSSTLVNRYVKGAGWSGATAIESDDTNENNLDKPALGMNSKGEAMAVWHQRQSGGTFDLWSSSFD